MAVARAVLYGGELHVFWSFDPPSWSPPGNRAYEALGILQGELGGTYTRGALAFPVGSYRVADISVDDSSGYDVTITLEQVTSPNA